MPKATKKSTSVQEEEEVIKIVAEDPETNPIGHSAVNQVEAWHHVQKLNEAIQTLEAGIDSG